MHSVSNRVGLLNSNLLVMIQFIHICLQIYRYNIPPVSFYKIITHWPSKVVIPSSTNFLAAAGLNTV